MNPANVVSAEKLTGYSRDNDKKPICGRIGPDHGSDKAGKRAVSRGRSRDTDRRPKAGRKDRLARLWSFQSARREGAPGAQPADGGNGIGTGEKGGYLQAGQGVCGLAESGRRAAGVNRSKVDGISALRDGIVGVSLLASVFTSECLPARYLLLHS